MNQLHLFLVGVHQLDQLLILGLLVRLDLFGLRLQFLGQFLEEEKEKQFELREER